MMKLGRHSMRREDALDEARGRLVHRKLAVHRDGGCWGVLLAALAIEHDAERALAEPVLSVAYPAVDAVLDARRPGPGHAHQGRDQPAVSRSALHRAAVEVAVVRMAAIAKVGIYAVRGRPLLRLPFLGCGVQ